jgi:phage gpG-like protein
MLEAEIRGLVELQRKVDQVVTDLHGRPMLDGMRQAAMLVTNDAKQLVPVDTRRLRSSITPEIRAASMDVIGVVGTNVIYAADMEWGTKPHMPPVDELEGWARRHGKDAYVVARAISKRGLKGRRYLRRAFDKNESRIKQIIGDVVGEIVAK